MGLKILEPEEEESSTETSESAPLIVLAAKSLAKGRKIPKKGEKTAEEKLKATKVTVCCHINCQFRIVAR